MTTALYRRYRPETFAEVVGQDHVTGPLRQALRSGQINHAYLFSGPRGCGKTTSARILARCLNCAEGPTDTPCGVCPSCVELARGGPGSLDVVEIDAASHGGVDDARDLRERATFAPARDRYKVFILDEAHMVSPQGFNALLKIVEEPPEHVKFIFATTEPDKVIGTIRSRTHHYPFRLVPPEIMTDYLGTLCDAEQVTVGSGVLPLVVRAGGGSVRDSLSVLDQLIAGSGPEGLVYEDAVALLGYTHASLLDDLVEAIAARDGASAFRVVERVISTGHEPRRFVEDLLERLRDLIVLQASGEAADAVLRDIPGDQLARMRTQAQHLGASELSRSADLANTALTEMSGATSPRLHLELLMARLLLPAMDDSTAGLGARVDRLERGVPVATGSAAPAVNPVTPVERVAVIAGPAEPVSAPGPQTAASGAALARAAMAAGRTADDAAPRTAADSTAGAELGAGRQEPAGWDGSPAAGSDGGAAETPGESAPTREPASTSESAPAPETAPTPESAAPTVPTESVPGDDAAADPNSETANAAALEPTTPAVTEPEPQPAATAAIPAGGAPADPGPAAARTGAGQDTEMLRRRWPEVLETLARLKKTTWVLISQNAQVIELSETTLTLGFTAPGLATAFRGGQHADLVHQAVRETLGFDVRVEGTLAGDAPPAAAPAAPPAPTAAPADRETRPTAAAREHDSAPSAAAAGAEDDEAPADPWAQATPTAPDTVESTPEGSADADWPEVTPIPGSTEPESAGSDWPEAAPIPGSTASTGPETSPQDSGAVDWPTVATIPDGTAAAAGTHGDEPAAVDAGSDAAEGGDEPGVEPSGTDSAHGAAFDAVPADDTGDASSTIAHSDIATPDAAPSSAEASAATPAGGTATVAATPTVGTPSVVAPSAAAPSTVSSDAVSPDTAHPDEPPLADEPPPPWDDPEDPGAPEPPEDPWASRGSARAATATPRPDAAPSAPSTPANRSSSAVPGMPLSGADRVRAAMARDAGRPQQRATPASPNWADDEPSMDDPEITASGTVGIPLVIQALGGIIIEEQIDDAM